MAALEAAKCDFALEITSPITFRNAIDIIGNTLALATFYVESDPRPCSDEAWLKVDSMDATQVCAIKLRIVFHGSVAAGRDDAHRFTLKLRMLLVLLKTMATTDTLHIYRLRGEDGLRLRSVGADTQEYELKTLAETYPPIAINDIVSTAFSIEFDVARLKMMTKVATSVRADHLRFRVLSEREGEVRFVISCDGDDAGGVWEFRGDARHSDAAADDGGAEPPRKRAAAECRGGCPAADAATSTSPRPCAYDATFPVGYITSFVKAMDRATIVITLSRDHPLVIEYPLGLERSNIRFLLAPRIAAA